MVKSQKRAEEASKQKPNVASQDPSAQIQKLEVSLSTDDFNPNPLLPLISFARHNDPEVVHKAVWALHRVFIRYIAGGKVAGLSGDLVTPAKKPEIEGDVDVKGWVRERLLEYVEVLGGLIRDAEPALRSSSIPLLFSLLAPLSASASSTRIIHIPYFRLLLHYFIFPRQSLRGAKPKQKGPGWKIVAANQCEDEAGVLPDDVAGIVSGEFWAAYDDIRWAFFKEAAQLAQTSLITPHSDNLLTLTLPLTNLPKVPADINTFYLPFFSSPPPDSNSTATAKKSRSVRAKKGKAKAEVDALPEWMKAYESSDSESDSEVQSGKRKRTRTSQLSIHASIYSILSQTSVYTSLWESILSSVPLDEVWTRRILAGLHGEQGILAHFKKERRLRIADWLGSLVDAGGAMAMLAMNGLFVLMTEYNFEYPNFYARLYSLLTPVLLHTKYRARFFRLLTIFLSSSLMPSTLIASFIKRLSLLCLTAPPQGIVMVLPFIYNLFKKHPGCMVLLQRKSSEDPLLAVSSFTPTTTTVNPKDVDPFDPEEKDPLKTKALESSLWEIAALQHHYLSSVSTLAKVFGEPFTKAEYNMEDFLDHSYNTLFETEANRRIKNAPALSIDIEAAGGKDIVAFPPAMKNEGVEENGDLVTQLWAF
ncbi:U3 small nucleolar RNA-associated protein 19 [Cryptococcus gattii E566]|uniref:Nucleolar complex protein 4 (U3 small nucleolar RNA-associated protein 19), putative n=2 Tax=Cryptococcus gattii TaxID=37769 RepID=E6R7J8_CRYGW|nr:Nucleolar complex protein 4 (U3 small nucleolar RNA-associated protein 19), putative [Cryptococcus gattii WM276]ADV22769.1 Nucleolar complex protein 4 (U3 small nucleolar RNA-associated protein 19), putative [Cryptococcus gattii WM276]KIR82753.1 U3 small nucleolar RNA-associated protein 19 [Cryptococcus gattii EJB2]KIY32358.1 U3 small nucleolar RNA-associated protein 19 [Cryptococcus gattii E566]KJE04638.1 U3 small nucleolar RNA-associated protein 19 [Cryptococcus gattii NT-10]